MDWKDIATVELPATAQTGDLIGVVDQLEQQVKAALSTKVYDPPIPHIKSLAPVVDDAFDDLIAARNALTVAEAQRKPAVDAAGPQGDRAVANRTADSSWRALEKFLAAAMLLEDDTIPGHVEAGALHARLFGFPGGLAFTNLRPRRQWDAAQRLVAILKEDTSVETVEGLNGGRFLKAVFAYHRDFGLAFGFSTATRVGTQAVTSTRVEQLALQGALREYLLKVTAQVSPKRPETAALAEFLLKPYADMVDDLDATPRAAPVKAEPQPATA
jgi:hypothetical protein